MKQILLVMTMMLTPLFAFASPDHGAKPDAHLVFAASGYHAHLKWEQGPQEGVESILRIEFMNPNTHMPTAIPFDVAVKLFMPSMGHGSSPTKIEKVFDANGEELPGVYRVSKVQFLMAGDWELRITIKNETESETQVYALTVDGSMDGGHHH